MGLIKYINDRKLKEFRIRRNIYDIPEDFHTNPKYKVYDELIPLYIKHESSYIDSFFKVCNEITKSLLVDYLSIKCPSYKSTINTIDHTTDTLINNKED